MAEKMNSNTETVQENSTMDKKTDSTIEAAKKTETAGTKAAVKKEETAGTKATVKKEAAAGTQGTVKKEAAAGTKATVKKEAAAGTKATAAGTKATAGTKAAAGTKATTGTKAAAGTKATVKKEAAAGTAAAAGAPKGRRKLFSFTKKGKPGNDPAAQKKQKAGDGPQELSDALEGLISKDISTMKHREKTRAAEMLSIFANHNFYAGSDLCQDRADHV